MCCRRERSQANRRLNKLSTLYAVLWRCTLQPGSSMCTCYRLLYLRADMVINSLFFFFYCFSCCLLLLMYYCVTSAVNWSIFFSGTKILSAISPDSYHYAGGFGFLFHGSRPSRFYESSPSGLCTLATCLPPRPFFGCPRRDCNVSMDICRFILFQVHSTGNELHVTVEDM